MLLRSVFYLLMLFLVSACSDLEPDRLYAIKLESPPSSTDWEKSLGKTVWVKGGRLNKLDPLPEVDKDTVHTSTASCHHGSSLPDPVAVEMSAFYTDKDLFLRLTWADASRDDKMRGWAYDGSSWKSSGAFEDGFGIVWDMERSYPEFTCSYACHLDDFGVSGQSFRGHNKMKLATPESRLDLWNWKAGRTGRMAFADDRYIDQDGMHGDLPGELFHPNSLLRVRPQGGKTSFSEGDRPLYDYEGKALEGQTLTLFSRAPGYLVDRPSGDRADVYAHSEWHDGRWTVILRRALKTGSKKDAQFEVGVAAAINFGVSLMDNSLYEHYASTIPVSLLLLPAQTVKTSPE